MSYDIYKKHKEFKDGKLSDLKFKKYIAKRVTRGTIGVAGGVGGGIIGQVIIPVPILGAFIGGFVGGILGAAVGHGQGILIGELVEVIDNKVKEKNNANNSDDSSTIIQSISGSEISLNKSEESLNQEKQEPAIKETFKSKFSVLDKLVFKYDKNILKAENFAHLKQNKVIDIKNINDLDENSILSSTDSTKVFKNANEFIDIDDYEIYKINETNEIETDLNLLANALEFDDNSQNKRASLEQFSADQLPSDLSVYFSIKDEKVVIK
jgi:hypothetical protein